jgi:NADH-quinone oxidoreductase subunit M
LGGLAQKAPGLAILLVIVALANVALPLTNAFVGEFLLFSGIFTSEVSKHGPLLTVIAGLSIILSAVYTLNMIQRVFYGNTNSLTATTKEIKFNEKLVLGIVVIVILVVGVYPKPFLQLTEGTVDTILSKMIIKQPS